MAKNLTAVMAKESLDQLAHAVDVLRRAEDVRTVVIGHSHADLAEYHSGRVVQSLEDLDVVEVYGVRDARDSFSKILNQASEGQLAFIESGKGGAVVVMSTDALTQAVLSLEVSRDETLKGLLDGLPFKTGLPELKVRGRRPARGTLTRLGAEAGEEPIAMGRPLAAT